MLHPQDQGIASLKMLVGICLPVNTTMEDLNLQVNLHWLPASMWINVLLAA